MRNLAYDAAGGGRGATGVLLHAPGALTAFRNRKLHLTGQVTFRHLAGTR